MRPKAVAAAKEDCTGAHVGAKKPPPAGVASDKRAETRKSSALKIEHYLHKMDLEASKFSFELNGVYAGLNSQNIFSCLAPYIGLQVSKYQSIMGSTIWYSDTPSKIEEQLSPLYNASQHEERPMRRANI